MARNGTGTYVLPAGQPVVTGTTISSTVFNTLTSDLATALSTSVCTDGQTPMTASLNMGTNKIIGLSDGTLATHAASKGQLDSATAAAQVAVQGRNLMHNSRMLHSNRGTTLALTTSPVFGSLDRWAAVMVTSAAGIWNQVAAPAQSGFSNVGKLGRNSGSASTGQIAIGQACETSMSLRTSGKTVILSFYAYAGANFSASGSLLTAIVRSGTGTDQSTSSLLGATWTGNATVISQSATLTTTLTRYTFTGTVASTATQIGVVFAYTPVGTAGADDNVYITGVQLEVAQNGQTAASTLEELDFTTDFNICRRFFQTINFTAVGYVGGASTFGTTAIFPVRMRATPTVGQLINNYLITQVNVSASTSIYIADNSSCLAYRTASGAGNIQFSEAASLTADL
jgi:hypothetical protein